MADLKCPNCARDFVRRVSRAGLSERLLSVFYVYPFKCQLCGYRFRFFQIIFFSQTLMFYRRLPIEQHAYYL